MAAEFSNRALFCSVFACALLFVAMLEPAMAQSGYVWHGGQFIDESGGKRAAIGYGVPETDDSPVNGFCHAGAPGLATMAFAANVGGLPDGAPVTLDFRGAGFSLAVNGVVSLPRSEEGASVVEVQLTLGDPLWQGLARLGELSYSVNNGPPVPLGLSGSSRVVDAFLRQCGAIFASGNGAGPVSDPRWATCQAQSGARSLRSDVPVSVVFRNLADGYRSVMWIGFDGMPVQYANLNPGETFSVNTYVTHPWMITDGPGNCIEMFMPQPGRASFDITAPGRDFGPE